MAQPAKRRGGDIAVAQQAAIESKRQRKETTLALIQHEKQFDVPRYILNQLGRTYGMLVGSPLVDVVGNMVVVKRDADQTPESCELSQFARQYVDASEGRTTATRTAQSSSLDTSRKQLASEIKSFSAAVWLVDRWWRRNVIKAISGDPRSTLMQTIDDVGYDETPAEVAGTTQVRFTARPHGMQAETQIAVRSLPKN
eukprot:7033466-Pyramimonas_sp.AAC.1